jgi:hypothetical protein
MCWAARKRTEPVVRGYLRHTGCKGNHRHVANNGGEKWDMMTREAEYDWKSTIWGGRLSCRCIPVPKWNYVGWI